MPSTVMKRAVPGSDSIAVYGTMSLPCHCRNRSRSVSITGLLACAGVTPGLSGAIMGFPAFILSFSAHVLTALIARSASDEAIHSFSMRQDGLLRCARNDG